MERTNKRAEIVLVIILALVIVAAGCVQVSTQPTQANISSAIPIQDTAPILDDHLDEALQELEEAEGYTP